MPRIGGNPDLVHHQFQPKGDESNNVRLGLWISQSMMEALKAKPNKNEFVRQAIAQALKLEHQAHE